MQCYPFMFKVLALITTVKPDVVVYTFDPNTLGG